MNVKMILQSCVLFALTACSQESVDESVIKQKLALMAQGEEKQDPKLIGSLFAKDATLINLSSDDTCEGVEEILVYYTENLQQRGSAQVALTTKSIAMKEPNIAVAIGKIDLTFSEDEKESIAFKAQFQKQADNSWLLTAWTEANLTSSPSSYEQLKGLEWLVGNWKNSDGDSQFSTKNSWDKYKNFLTQTFSLSILGEKELFGKQIIGWDPREEKIRSWIFDSEGGFGEGSWYQDGSSWFVTVRYTMSDGSLASSTQVFQKVDDSSYQFSSSNRDIDGQILPNIGPFTLTSLL